MCLVNLRRIRGFLQLNQRDVELATGIPIYRLARAEAGTLTLNDVEHRVLEHFYRVRWKMALEESAGTFSLDS